MDPVHESSPWTRSKVGVGPLVHVLSSRVWGIWGTMKLSSLNIDCITLVHVNLIRLFTASYKIVKFIKHFASMVANYKVANVLSVT